MSSTPVSPLSDEALTRLYFESNGLDPKRHHPITTERIFAAMRAAAALGSPSDPPRVDVISLYSQAFDAARSFDAHQKALEAVFQAGLQQGASSEHRFRQLVGFGEDVESGQANGYGPKFMQQVTGFGPVSPNRNGETSHG